MNYGGTFTQYCNDLVNLYKKREGLGGDEARRLVLDMIDDVKESFEEGVSPQCFYEGEE